MVFWGEQKRGAIVCFIAHHYPITLTTNLFRQSLDFLEQTYLKKSISALVNTAQLAPMIGSR